MMRERISDMLRDFQPISLTEIGRVRFMTRTDSKYQCRIAQLPGLLEKARPLYRVLEIEGNRLPAYESLYLDTAGHKMYIDHHNGKMNRYKIRIREYLTTKEFFLEIKKKNSAGKTEKKRMPIPDDRNYLSPDHKEFLKKHSPFEPESLIPAITSSFSRITLVNKEYSERVTIDILPAWSNEIHLAALTNLVIIEIKSVRTTTSTGFGQILRDGRIFPHRISKYCTGTVLLHPELKHNRFKTKMLHLKKLDNNLIYNEPSHAII
jgi:hypothetical protein